jgi:hypothetical protein
MSNEAQVGGSIAEVDADGENDAGVNGNGNANADQKAGNAAENAGNGNGANGNGGSGSGDTSSRTNKGSGGKSGGSSSADGLTWLKESMTSLLAAAIVVVALALLWRTFTAGGGSGKSAPSIFARDKDVLQYILPILGTVIGYYFGRVPAERRAEKAEQTATGAQKQAESSTESAARANVAQATAEQQTQQLRADTRATLTRVQNALTGNARSVLSAGGVPAADTQLALAELRALDDRLNL